MTTNNTKVYAVSWYDTWYEWRNQLSYFKSLDNAKKYFDEKIKELEWREYELKPVENLSANELYDYYDDKYETWVRLYQVIFED
jgi:hypothetical protein